MTDVNKPVAEPSAAAPVPTIESPAFNPADQNTWSPEQREHWNKTGDVPEAPKKSDPAPTDPPKEVTSEGKPKTEAETETAQEQEKTSKGKPARKPDAEERISQLTATVKQLEERLREREAAAKPPEKPETKVDAPPVRPNPFKWAGTPEEYEAALAKYEQWRDGDTLRKFQEQQRQELAANEMKQKLEDAKVRYPDAIERIQPAVLAILNDAQIPNAIKAVLDESDIATDVMYVLGEPEKLGQFIQLARSNPVKALREILTIEGLVREELAKAKGEAKPGAAAAAGDGEPTKKDPPAQEKPRAPKPPSEVGGRGTVPEDPRRTAAAAGDFRSFEAEENRRLQARHKQ